MSMGSSLEDFYVRFADQLLKIAVQHLETKNYVRDYIVDVEEKDKENALQVQVTSEDVIQEWKFFLSREGYDKAFVNRLPAYYFEIFALHRKVAEALVYRNIIAIHGSCVAVDGKAYIFVAKSGTGKSTHVKLWCDTFGGRALLLNDDKPWLRLMPDGTLWVYGSPWTGKHHRGVNRDAKLSAIGQLFREDGASVKNMAKQEAMELLLKQTIHPAGENKKEKFQNLLEKVCAKVPFYYVGSDRSKESIRFIFSSMKEGPETDL